jgi:hypothetical protein
VLDGIQTHDLLKQKPSGVRHLKMAVESRASK